MRIVRVLAAALAASTVAGAAFAADLPSRKRAPVPAYVAPAPVFTWTGFYIGANAGGWFNDSKIVSIFGSNGKIGGGGFLVGGTAGYNWQASNNFVVGVETDLDYRSKASVTPPLALATNTTDGVLGTARLRAGVAIDRALLYVTGGLAYGNHAVPNALVSPFLGVSGVRTTASTFGVGWTAGAGAEFAINNNWSVKGEYLYANLGSKGWNYTTPTLAPVSVSGTSAAHTAKMGLNYRFGFAGGAPVYAKY